MGLLSAIVAAQTAMRKDIEERKRKEKPKGMTWGSSNPGPKLPSSPFKGIKLLESKEIPTPFGTVDTPSIELPPLKLPTLEDRHRKALGHAVGIDAADILGLIPYFGGTLANSLRAMHTRQIKNLLTPEEYDKYMKWDKTYPDAIALLRSRL